MNSFSKSTPHSLYLVDASGFIFRAFHALPPLLNPEGSPVGAVYGFLSMLIRLLSEHRPQRLGIVFDVSRKTFRQDLYPEYKANRPPPPSDLISQFSLVREACQAFGLPILECEGFEADDVLATYAVEATKAGEKVTLVSSDKDLMQLISPDVRLWDPIKNKPLGEKEVIEKFGVPPSQVIEVQALLGDPSDNVPGVPGVGIKTASELINLFHSLENLYDHIDNIPQSRRRELLTTHREKAFLSRELVYLKTTVPLPAPLTSLDFRGLPMDTVRAFLKKQAFHSLEPRLSKIPPLSAECSLSADALPETLHETPSKEATPQNFILIQNLELLQTWALRARQQGWIAIDLETTALDTMVAEIVGVALALTPGEAAYVPLTHETSEPQILFSDALKVLGPLLADPSVLKIGHHLKYDAAVLKRYDLALTPFDDTLLLSYTLYGGKHPHNLDFLARTYLSHENITYADVTGEGKKAIPFRQVSLERALAYAAEDADVTLRLWSLFREALHAEHLVTIYERLERPLVPVLLQIERTGICVDTHALQELSSSFESQLNILAQEIYLQAGTEFNIASPKQLGSILFEHLGFEGGKKGKTGAYGTASDVLETLARQGQKIAETVLEWRGLAKLKNTYTDTLPLQVNPETGRIHTSFVMAGTSTGRLASTDPNLQNIPIRTAEGRAIRRTFIPARGNLFASFDYSQIELRLLAHMGNVPALIQSFLKGLDVHQETASQIFGVPLDQVDKSLRRKAKTINFGIIYGMSAFGLGERLGIPTKEAALYMSAYFDHYHGIKEYMERTKQYARDNGFVETLWGRRCTLPGIHDRNPVVRQAAERQAINAPLQGTAADFIKLAMIRIHHFLAENNWPIRMILQIHDELLFEGPEKELEKLSNTLVHYMTDVATLQVPLLVDRGMGSNWEEAH